MHDAAEQVVDVAERRRALDIAQSFIVRAPAGSGKTRLLIARYLTLLATVDEPEEVIAITFTRKAAAEMRARVLAALQAGDTHDDTALLARRVLARDAARGWQLLSGASRLRIQTIDALNTSLTRQMPLLSRFGAQPESVDDATPLYRRAARRLLEQINDAVNGSNAVADDVATLLMHLDNNLGVAESLIADMLRARDHWLRNLPGMHVRAALEAALARVRTHALAEAAAHFPLAEKNETLQLVRFSGQNLLKDGVNKGLSQFYDLSDFPSNNADSLPAWLAIADLLLTQDGNWRKPRGINKSIGFPTSQVKAEKILLDAMKTRIGELLSRLAADDTLAARLHRLRGLPPGTYSDAQWQVLGAIVRLLPWATAHLWSVFGAAGQCDFTEIAQAASRALGTEDAPTDLALALDHRIRHVLVDEFQDTSFAQYELLEKLTRGWSPDDGRSLFVVGDPMQSIYRFREAEVGLFLRARHAGVGNVALAPLTLRVNFRSTPGVVAWVNHTFSQLMPPVENITSGVVPYADSIAFAGGAEDAIEAVRLHWNVLCKTDAPDADLPDGESEEAAQVINIIRQTRDENADATIAILIRNRGHLRAIVPALKAANIAFHAVDIDPLKDLPVVQDLLALTRALLHPADRIAWLAVLRAPWCGLALHDLAALTGGLMPVNAALHVDARTIWEMASDPARVAALSNDGQRRLGKWQAVLQAALAIRRQVPLRDAVEQCWLSLGGPACLLAEDELADAMTFLDLLEAEARTQSGGAQIVDLAALSARMERLFSGGGMATEKTPVQIMTIHKAKGLEFDTVIVPGLHRAPRKDDKKLLVWAEQPDMDSGERELLLAPIRETGSDSDDDTEADAIYQYIRDLNADKQRHENVRLMYVAATRAVRRLHLLASLTLKEKDGVWEIAAPKPAGLLGALWPAVQKHAEAAAADRQGNTLMMPVNRNGSSVRAAARLDIDFTPPPMPPPVAVQPTGAVAQCPATITIIDFEWAGDLARHIGTVVHVFLQRIAADGVAEWNAARIDACRALFAHELARLGVADDDLGAAAIRIAAALQQTLNDARGQWILRAQREAKSEWRLTGVVDSGLVNVAIDRTFVDDGGVRWIIDFKTGGHQGADVAAFLDNEQKRYRSQLETYARLLAALRPEEKNIRLGLYFPLLGGWREWDWP